MKDSDYRQKVEAILRDRISGSSVIADEIEEIFLSIPETDLVHTLRKIVKIHGSMAAVTNRINRLCLEKEGRDIPGFRDMSGTIHREFWETHCRKKNWITLSMSGAVIECLQKSPHPLHIKVGISYPHREGIITRNKLKDSHQVLVYEDNKLSSEVEHCDAVILGADRVGEDEIVNKCGSFPLALAAQYFRKPLYIITSGEKFLSPDLFRFHRSKVVHRKSRLIHYFETVPRRLITAIYFTSDHAPLPLSNILKNMEK